MNPAAKYPAEVRDRIEQYVARTGETRISAVMAATGYDYQTVHNIMQRMRDAE